MHEQKISHFHFFPYEVDFVFGALSCMTTDKVGGEIKLYCIQGASNLGNTSIGAWLQARTYQG